MKERFYKTDSDVVKTEGPNRYSRDEAVFAANAADHVPGVVLGRVTVGGKVVPWDPEAEDGSEVIDSVLLETVPAGEEDKRVVILSRMAEVVLQALVWPAGITDTQRNTALAALNAKGIVARMGV